jgi:DNA-directed RNA polymerase specialized sigma24 family protein
MDAQDLTQEFFARLIEHKWIARADRQKGRFRSFLLMAMKRFLANEWDKVHTQKRGGDVCLVPVSLDTAETRYSREPADTTTPEQVFERQWALTFLETVLHQLRAAYAQDGKAALFDELKACLVGSRETQPYAELGARLGLTEGAVKVAVSRLRQRYREQLREEMSHMVAAPAEVDSELRHLFRALAQR